jgi:hypothetical protein
MATIVYETDDDVREVTVSELKYNDDTDCWWYYTEGEGRRGNRARYVPRERVFYIERGR